MQDVYICSKCSKEHKVIKYGAQPGRVIFDELNNTEYYFCENCAEKFNAIFMPMRSQVLYSFIQPERLSEKTRKGCDSLTHIRKIWRKIRRGFSA